METANGNGLILIETYYGDYGYRARALKQTGKRMMGYISAAVPVEIMHAAGFIPVRIKGDPKETVTKAYGSMETLVCPFLLNAYNLALKGKYDYLEGIVIPHTCDSVCRTYDVWKRNFPLPYYHFLNVPHLDSAPSQEFFKEILKTFVKSLEQFIGKEISGQDLANAVLAYNDFRKTMRELYDLRKPDQPLISGIEMMKTLVAVKALPVDESTALIRQIINEAKGRKASSPQKPLRVMLVSDQIDDTALIEIIENTGAQVVMDDISVGSKLYFADIEATSDPIDGIAEYYLKKVNLPTFYRDKGGSYDENLELRFGHLKRFISEFNVDAVILLVYKNCDPYGFEVPATISYIESLSKPVFYVEDEYSSSSSSAIKTRIEAFLEMLTQERR
ncbi:MAG: R-phenyllactate dehydratase beta subunit [Syntrophorhabdus sp. PtaU1.Bin058]|nr:MAG: R-phenyllactate dehydratase beta subunit [Syntrophorhabdus sp. PtaU1.Bin058]